SAIGSNRTRSVGGANQTVPSNAFGGPHPLMLNPHDDPASVYGQQNMDHSQRGSGDTAALVATGLGAVGGVTAGYFAVHPEYGQPHDGGNVRLSAQEQHPLLAIWIESRTQPPQASAVPATPSPSDYIDNMSISSSTIPPSYHTHYSYPDLPSYLATPPSPGYGSTQDPPVPQSAFISNRTRSHPHPLPSTDQEDPFADSQEQEGARRPSQAVDGGVRLAGGASDSRRVVGDEWDYQISWLDVMLLPDYGEDV
ncbi:hypothetical protein BD311DRAFT_604268, partial [Dichomitus squalens]